MPFPEAGGEFEGDAPDYDESHGRRGPWNMAAVAIHAVGFVLKLLAELVPDDL